MTIRDDLAKLIDGTRRTLQPSQRAIDAADSILASFDLVPKGSVVVPAEPTEAMLEAMTRRLNGGENCEPYRSTARAIWRAGIRNRAGSEAQHDPHDQSRDNARREELQRKAARSGAEPIPDPTPQPAEMTDLTKLEIEVLKSLAGLPSKITGWGAAYGAAIEHLRSVGLCKRNGAITEKGRQELQNYKEPTDDPA